MNEFFKKLSTYDLFVNFMPGCLFAWYLRCCKDIEFVSWKNDTSIIDFIVLCYIIGLFVNRIGSLAIEPIGRKLKFLEFAPYASFVDAEEIDSKIIELSEVNNFYRSLVSLSFVIVLSECISGMGCAMEIVGEWNRHRGGCRVCGDTASWGQAQCHDIPDEPIVREACAGGRCVEQNRICVRRRGFCSSAQHCSKCLPAKGVPGIQNQGICNMAPQGQYAQKGRVFFFGG